MEYILLKAIGFITYKVKRDLIMNKTCKNCIYFKNNTCIQFKSPNAYQAVEYDVCIYWAEETDEKDE